MIELARNESPARDSIEIHKPLLVDAETAAGLLSIGKRKLWELTNCGEIPSVKIGRCVRYAVADLTEYVEQLRRG
jgi:excisionase family DNA binding protein